MPWSEREKVLNTIREYLERRSEVELALVFGGFISCEVFRDVDVALYTGHRVPVSEEFTYIDEVRDELERRVGFAVDVVLLDYAPPRFRIEVLRRGVVLVERVPGLRAILLLHALDEVKGLERTRHVLGTHCG